MLIFDQIKSKNYYFDKENLDIDRIWNKNKKKFINSLDLIAPRKTFKQKPNKISPWFDEE